eukprot:4926820-Pyramimonas_sp.AAC.1
MAADEATSGLAQKAEDGGLGAVPIQWAEFAADYQFLPKLVPPELAIDQAQTDRAGQIKHLRRAPKRRVCPAWGLYI